MKKLLLILLCLPMIGFGQILDTSYVIACDSYEIPNGFIYTVTQSGIYYWANCDGMGFSDEGYIAVTILNSSSSQQVISICDGDSVSVGSSVYNTIGNYIDVLTAANGCDSIVYTNISIAAPIVWQWGTSICNGDSVIVGNSVYNTTGVYTDTLATTNGCDSIVYTNISIDYNTSSYDTLSVTASIVWNGLPLSVSGDYSTTLINSVGCDSIANLNLTVTTTGISDVANCKSNLVKITDILGQETPQRRNTPLFYIYDDGTVEKRIIIE